MASGEYLRLGFQGKELFPGTGHKLYLAPLGPELIQGGTPQQVPSWAYLCISSNFENIYLVEEMRQ